MYASATCPPRSTLFERKRAGARKGHSGTSLIFRAISRQGDAPLENPEPRFLTAARVRFILGPAFSRRQPDGSDAIRWEDIG